MIIQPFNKKMTKLCKPTFVQIYKRFYPGKDKLIQFIGSNPSKSLVEMFHTIEGKRLLSIAYLSFLSKIYLSNHNYNIHSGLNFFYNLKNSNDYCAVKNKENFLQINGYTPISNASIKAHILPAYSQEIKHIMINYFSFLTDSKIPASNWTKLLILERVSPNIISTGFTRAFLFDCYVIHQNNTTGDYNIMNKFIIHVANGKAGIDFISELVIAHQHQKTIDKMSSIKVKEYHMLAKLKPGSEESNNSMKYTGQPNCDIQLVLTHTKDKYNFNLYLDIKQKELDYSQDNQYLFLKVNYTVSGKQILGIIDNLDHANDYLEMCLAKIQELDDLNLINSFILKINKLEKIADKLFFLHEFILSNITQHPKLQMTLMVQTTIQPENSIYTQIAEKEVSKVPDNVLTNKTFFENFSQEMYKEFIKQHSGDVEEFSRIKHLEKHFLNNKIFKPCILEDNPIDTH